MESFADDDKTKGQKFHISLLSKVACTTTSLRHNSLGGERYESTRLNVMATLIRDVYMCGEPQKVKVFGFSCSLLLKN